MEPSSKRQAVERSTAFNFFQWITMFFGCALECDSPILESLYHTMFLFLDLAIAMNPAALYLRMRERKWPATEKAAWWERLKRLTMPKLKSLFPPVSPFADFDKWFKCSCWDSDDRRKFPQTLAGNQDPDFWMLCCASCISKDQDIYEPKRDLYGADSVRITQRRNQRERLKKATDFFLGDWSVSEGVFRWGLLSNFNEDGTRMEIPWTLHGFEYSGIKYNDRSDALFVDFLAACFILSRPFISYQRWKGIPME
jgi:hypothetical protein